MAGAECIDEKRLRASASLHSRERTDRCELSRRMTAAARSAALKAIQYRYLSEPRMTSLTDHQGIAAKLSWSLEVLKDHANAVAHDGLPVAHLYLEAAAVSVDRAIRAVGAAAGQEGWPVDVDGGFPLHEISEWL